MTYSRNIYYAVPLQHTSLTYVNGSTYYIGCVPNTPNATIGNRSIKMPTAGTVVAVALKFGGTAGTNEATSLYLRKNSTDTTLSTTMDFSAVPIDMTVTGLNIPFVAGDTIALKLVCPTWASPPASIIMGGYMLIATGH